MQDDDNENWLLDAGDSVIEKKASAGHASLSPLERLIYCLWVADYGMRNAGDLEGAGDLHAPFMQEGHAAAVEARLPYAIAAFSLSEHELEKCYFELLDAIVAEIRSAWPRP